MSEQSLTSSRPKAGGVVVEKHWRSLLKTISWRLLGTLDTIVLSFIITGSLKMAASIGGVELITKMVLYYLHERVWSKLNIGKEIIQNPDYEI